MFLLKQIIGITLLDLQNLLNKNIFYQINHHHKIDFSIFIASNNNTKC